MAVRCSGEATLPEKIHGAEGATINRRRRSAPQRRNTMNGQCPECEGEVAIPSDAQTGEILICPDCGIELELTGLDPVQLTLAPKEAEDWGE
jgi:alpha-aminoadipate carrier protein LysW